LFYKGVNNVTFLNCLHWHRWWQVARRKKTK